VGPLTAMLPVVPGRVHSGVPPLSGAAVGQVLSAVAVSVEACVTADPEDELADGVLLSELHAPSAMTADAAQAASAAEEHSREDFTAVTLQPLVAWVAGGGDGGILPCRSPLNLGRPKFARHAHRSVSQGSTSGICGVQ
jgi:hypothetical protein